MCRILDYSHILDMIIGVGDDIYVRMMLDVIDMEERIIYGDISPRVGVSNVRHYQGSLMSRIMLSYTILKVCGSDSDWSIVLIDNIPYLVSDYILIVPSLLQYSPSYDICSPLCQSIDAADVAKREYPRGRYTRNNFLDVLDTYEIIYRDLPPSICRDVELILASS